MQRKLVREFFEVKFLLFECVKEVERGNKLKKMVEIFCDEFVKGIKSYEEEFYGLKYKNGVGWEERDQMVFYIVEFWFDERM